MISRSIAAYSGIATNACGGGALADLRDTVPEAAIVGDHDPRMGSSVVARDRLS
ncbi:MAG TPA: hypothetical protein VF933_00265 [Streptosporangiaceae bacterium]